MEFTHLGRSGLLVSRLCLGTMNFGPLTTEVDSFVIMDRAHDLGINFFDTANIYGNQFGKGRTESIIGRYFAKGGGRRDRTVLATKLYGVMGEWPNESNCSALNIRRACEASLARLKTDYIDLYQMHHIDRETPWEEIWEAMDVLRHQGKIIYVGSSNFAGWHIAQGQEAAHRLGNSGLVSEQSFYSLFNRAVELEVLPAAKQYGVGVIAWSPLHSGMLGGVLTKSRGSKRRSQPHAVSFIEEHRSQLEAYESLCKELGAEPSVVALAWLLTRPAVVGPIIGPRTLAQLNSAARAVELELDEATLARLDEIFPGHKEAPEDYAW